MAMLNIFFVSKRFFIIFFAIVTMVDFGGKQVYAQQCQTPYEMVTKLRHPDLGTYTVWDSIYGNDIDTENFTSVVRVGNDVLAVGEARAMKKDQLTLVFVRFDHRGRAVLEKRHKIIGLSDVVKILNDDDGYIVMANKIISNTRKVVWLGFFDKDLNIKSQKVIKDKMFDLSGTDITISANNSGWAVSVTSEKKNGEGKNGVSIKRASVYLLDKKGNEQSSRGYFLGLDNEILSLSVSKMSDGKTSYIATGYFENQSRKRIGWVLKLNSNLSLVWQKEHSRGLSANLNASYDYDDESVLVIGDVALADSLLNGSWLMSLDKESGKIIWQRYYYGGTGHHNYIGRGISVNKDGLIDVLMMAESTKNMSYIEGVNKTGSESMVDDVVPENMSYAHVLTLSPRGVTLSGDSYYYGQGVSIAQMIKGYSGGRILVGNSTVRVKEKVMDEDNGNDNNAINPPLKEKGDISLPDVDLSDETKAGLAMLKNKLKHHDDMYLADKSDYHKSSNGKKLDKDVLNKDSATLNGWILVSDDHDTYTDPCN